MTRPIVIASLICVLGAAPAAAQPQQPQPPQPQPQPPQPEPASESPAELFAIGKRHYDLAEYRPAIAAWKKAYMLSNEPLLLFNIAQAYRLSGDCAQANRFYFNYQRLVPKPPNRLELDEAMAKCRGVEPATGDTAEPGPTEPGPTGPTTGEPPRVPETPPEVPTVDRGRNLRLAGIGVGAAGGAVGIVSLVFGLSARSKASEIEGKPRNTPWTPELAELERDGEAAQARARVFAVISVAAIATGATLWWIGRSRSRMRIDVAAGAGQGEVSLSCVF